ncbi:MAG: thioredoxin domain-containing protein, partial [Alphaproteobacteria bacterium]|nr:thioredoxin domain-containing protein [Alphaproteobacteria bacterium]
MIDQAGMASQAADTQNDLIIDGSDQTFRQDVMEVSMTTPVIVDFWAPWCGPCKQLGPALEAAVKKAGGAVRMVKINVDENPMIAGQLRVQSIPAVYAFHGGQPIDGFMGALPESQIKEFVEKVVTAAGGQMGDPIEAALEQAGEHLSANEVAEAADLYTTVLEQAPNHIQATAGLADCYIKMGALEGAQGLMEALPEEVKNDPAFEKINNAIALAESASGALAEMDSLKQKVMDEPENHEAKIELANAYFASNKAE